LRVIVVTFVPVAITLALSALIGLALAWGSGAYLGSALLASAPGGIAEMSITAKVLGIGPPFVTAAHVTRFVIVVVLAAPLFQLAMRARKA
jgi:uncharacterized membrane protein AbrB (regulator of aidB expression)